MTPGTLLLGGSGFIGSALARRLADAGTTFSIADTQPSAPFPDRWRACDLRDAGALRGALRGVTTVVLLAGEHGLEPRPAHVFESVNVGGTRTMLAVARETGVQRIVFTSSAAVYGMPDTIADEASPCAPINEYGRTKLAAEELLRTWQSEDASRALVIVRPTVVFGPGVRGNMRAMFHRMARPDAVIVGSGANKKSFAHVANLAAFLEFMLDAPAGCDVFNYTDPPDMTMTELSAVIRGSLGAPATRVRVPKRIALAWAWGAEKYAAVRGREASLTRSQVQRLCASTQYSGEKSLRAGFRPPLGLREGLAQYARSDLRWTAGRTHLPPAPAANVHIA